MALMFTSDTVGDADADPAVKPNAKQTNVGGDFPHMFDISSGGARVLVFTDKEQETPEVVEVTAVTIVNAVVTGNKLRLWVSSVMDKLPGYLRP